ncbi:MAG: pilus assembly PilX N-terminal domain-containing protein [bacterium]
MKGSSLFLALMIMSLLLAVVLGVNAILMGQLKSIKNIGESVAAFYAADAGIEEILINQSSSCSEASPCLLENGASYYLNILAPGRIQSVGQFSNTKRALEINF